MAAESWVKMNTKRYAHPIFLLHFSKAEFFLLVFEIYNLYFHITNNFFILLIYTYILLIIYFAKCLYYEDSA